ncbi:DUF58 domain-containing protein [Coralloluteibacterium thermophilus]|uniref:DUF58 domain-containing protein n=1 Tax=Coralloluteibacterium thermophilum TaxID=2707049 RepID=A0ABV9NI43_9GAMM
MIDLIPPDLRAALPDLRLAPRRPAVAGGIGQHHSRSRGEGLEFSQYRAYEPGDELRRIDWKLYARSDRYFVREAERDSPLTLWLLVDASASMGQADAARPDRSRLDAARALAAACIAVALRQGDRFGLAIAGDGRLDLVPAADGPRQRDRCHLALHALHARGGWPEDAALRPLWERVAAGDLLLLLGDHFDEAGVAVAERLAAARREVSSIQILTGEERDFPFRGGHRFRDVEGGAEVLTDAASARSGFLAEFAAARTALAARLAAAGIAHATCFIDEPLDAPLRRLFGLRGRGGE